MKDEMESPSWRGPIVWFSVWLIAVALLVYAAREFFSKFGGGQTLVVE